MNDPIDFTIVGCVHFGSTMTRFHTTIAVYVALIATILGGAAGYLEYRVDAQELPLVNRQKVPANDGDDAQTAHPDTDDQSDDARRQAVYDHFRDERGFYMTTACNARVARCR